MINYDPSKVIILVNNNALTGFAEDSMIKGVRSSEKRSMSVGCKGEVTFCTSADNRGEITIKLKDTSPSNNVLMSLYQSDKEFPFACVDLNSTNGGDLGIAGSRCKIKNLPEFNRGKSVGESEWVLLVADYEAAFAGTKE